MDKTLRTGIVGLGIGRHHARGFQAVEGVELAAVCDTDARRLREIGDMFGVVDADRYTDYRTMLAEADLDIVSVCVPNALHAEVAIAALEAGLHVLCEKPLALDVAGAQAIVDAAERAKGKLMVCYDKRYRADSAWLREAYEKGVFGQVYQIEATWKREAGIPGGWFSRKADSGGGPLIDLGVHVLDLALWVLGFPAIQTVSGVTRAAFGPRGRKTPGWAKTGGGGNYDVEDGAVGLLRLADGAVLLLEASWADHRRPGEDDFSLRIAGTEAAAVMYVRDYTDKDTLHIYTEIDGTAVEAVPNLPPFRPGGHAALIADFVRAIREDTPPPSTGAQGLVTVRALDALYRSAAGGREVVLNL